MEAGWGFSVDLREKDLRLVKDMMKPWCTDRNQKKWPTRFENRQRGDCLGNNQYRFKAKELGSYGKRNRV